MTIKKKAEKMGMTGMKMNSQTAIDGLCNVLKTYEFKAYQITADKHTSASPRIAVCIKDNLDITYSAIKELPKEDAPLTEEAHAANIFSQGTLIIKRLAQLVITYH